MIQENEVFNDIEGIIYQVQLAKKHTSPNQDMVRFYLDYALRELKSARQEAEFSQTEPSVSV